MKIYHPIFCLVLFTQILTAQTNLSFVSNLPYENNFVSDVWGYAAPDGTEYALVGVNNGVSIVSLADVANPAEVAFVGGSGSIWRDMKTFGNYAYVTTEAADGLLVIDMSGLPDTTSHYFWTPSIDSVALSTCHNIYVDENGYGYLSGCNLNNGGFLVVDLFTDPLAPTFVGQGVPEYSHDIYVRDNIAYSSDIENGELSIHDVSDKSDIKLLATQQTPFSFTHNAWLSDDGKTIFTTEELGNASTTAYDISDLTDIKELDQFIPQATKGQGVIPHNVHVLNEYLVLSHYGDGCIIVDASRPENLVEVGNFDTSLGVSGLVGAWGAYPFLPSGLILVSDSENGLFVLQPTYQKACYLEGTITSSADGQPLQGVTITIDSTNISATSDLTGTFKTGTSQAGKYTVKIEKFGYESQEVEVDLINGEVTLVVAELVAGQQFNISGTTVADTEGNPIGGVQVQLFGAPEVIMATTDENGQFIFENVFESTYSIIAGKWGYKTVAVPAFGLDAAVNDLAITLEPGIEDPFAIDLGWEVINENIFVGNGFELAPPVFSNDLPLITGDLPDDVGDQCYITGNLPGIPDGLFIAGKTALVSPTFDISEMMNPTVNYHTNFAALVFGQQLLPGIDTLYVYLENGSEKVVVEKITTDLDLATQTLSSWRPSEIKVKDFITPTADMRISFELMSESFESVVEAAVDLFSVVDAETVSTSIFDKPTFEFAAYPNPFRDQVQINYDLSQWNNRPQAIMYDALGRVIVQEELNISNSLSLPDGLSEGLYFIQLKSASQQSQLIKLVKSR